MTRYTNLYSAIATLESNTREPDFIPSAFNFPFEKMYPGQMEILKKVQNGESFCLTSHTGFGKSACFLSLTRGTPSIVIEPRKFLQAQISTYFDDFVLYGRSGYPCPLADTKWLKGTASNAPCLTKEPCNTTDFHKICPDAQKGCTSKPCSIFQVDPINHQYKKFPCKECAYLTAVKKAIDVVRNNGTCICNFGNFWTLLKYAKTVVIDEADLFFREVSSPVRLRFSNPRKHPNDDIKTLLSREAEGLRKDALDKTSDPKTRYAATNAANSAEFLLKYHDLCFKYQRKDWYYIEIDPRNTNILCEKSFVDKRVVIVSATPGAFSLPSHSASIHQRAGIYFAPVGNLTSRSLKENPYLMNTAAKAIAEISDYMDMVYDANKIIIFCGNLGTHAASLFKILGEEQCDLHQSGKLAESLEKFKTSDKRYFLVAGAEWGLDAEFCKLQFLLKHPFPNLDERARTLQKVMGKDEFSKYYEEQARNRVTQSGGRNVRGYNDFGVTICLDSKTHEDFVRNRNLYPDWFVKRVDTRCY